MCMFMLMFFFMYYICVQMKNMMMLYLYLIFMMVSLKFFFSKTFIKALIKLEMLSAMNLMYLMIMEKNLGLTGMMFFFFLVFIVCEAILGISLLVKYSRLNFKIYLNNIN